MSNVGYYLSNASQYMRNLVSEFLGDVWRWFTLLNREEWMILLAIVAGCGFLCMRGFGSRSEF